MLPRSLKEALKQHLLKVKLLHEQDLRAGFGSVYLPDALARKYKNAERELAWQYVFPASKYSIDPRTGKQQRHHLHETVLQQAVKNALRAAAIKPSGVGTSLDVVATARTSIPALMIFASSPPLTLST